jgi:hypothetical protein
MNKKIFLSSVAVLYALASLVIKSSQHVYGFQWYNVSTSCDFAIKNFLLMIVYDPLNFLVVSWDSYGKSIILFPLFISTSAMTFYPLFKI